MSQCSLCGGEILNRSSACYCVYCNATFHRGCISEHFYHNKCCPVCKEKMSLLYMRHGLPSEPAARKEPIQREIRRTEIPSEKRTVPVFDTYTPTRPVDTGRVSRPPRAAPVQRSHVQEIGLEDIIRGALEIIRGNKIIATPYLIVLVLIFVGFFVGWGYLIPVEKLLPPSAFNPEVLGFESDFLAYNPELLGFETDFFAVNPEVLIFQSDFFVHALRFPYNILWAFSDFYSIVGILCWGFSVIASAITISMTYNVIRRRSVTLLEAWEQTTNKLATLLIVNIILTIALTMTETMLLYFDSFILPLIGNVLLSIFFIFINQGVMLDDLDISATIVNSCRIAKGNFFSILILILFFIFAPMLVDFPLIEGVLNIPLELFFTVTFTIFYLDRS